MRQSNPSGAQTELILVSLAVHRARARGGCTPQHLIDAAHLEPSTASSGSPQGCSNVSTQSTSESLTGDRLQSAVG
jgi:hypothetical protein